MPHSAETPPTPQRVLAARSRWAILLAPAAFAATAMIGLLLIRARPDSVAIPWVVLGLLAAALLLAVGGLVFHHFWHWRRPIRRLVRALRELRSGDFNREELAEIAGPLTELVQQLRVVIEDEHRSALRQADWEMRRKLAQRTDALEHTISSLRLQASRDALTGLCNRRMLDQHLPQMVKHAIDTGGDLCLVMLDLDNFKLLNDTLGHSAGDEFLRSVGQLIRSTIRQQDLAFRFGGDELVIILRDGNRDAAAALVGRVVSLVNALGRTYRLLQPAGISAGLAMLRDLLEPTADALLAEADRRLYSEKQRHKSVSLSA